MSTSIQNAARQKVMIAAKLYEAQDTLRRLLGAGYDARVEPMRQILRAKARGRSVMVASLELLTKLQNDGRPAGELLAAMAATVDVAEASGQEIG